MAVKGSLTSALEIISGPEKKIKKDKKEERLKNVWKISKKLLYIETKNGK